MILPGFDEVRHHWGWVLALGILLFVLGVFATSAAIATTLLTVMVIGMLLLVAGGMEMVNAFSHPHYVGFWMHLFAGILDMVCGLLFLAYPGAAAVTLTLILAFFFIVGGTMRTISALLMHLPSSTWAALSGIVDIALGIMLVVAWPASGFWFLGLAVGIGLLFRGAWWAAFALAAHKKPVPLR
jgi:uncharacterized membrane protein HdeD (DUF308 family)